MALAATTPVLARFHPIHAAAIASWIRDERQLQWVSPSTEPPLTAEKVQRWPRPDGEAFVLLAEGDDDGASGLPACAAASTAQDPVAYAEINHMRSGGGNWWIGHFIVRPDRRGQGLGRLLLSDLLKEAFERLLANSVCLVVFPDNKPAIRCYESAGFMMMGSEYHRFGSHKPRVRMARYEITKEAWMKTPAASRCVAQACWAWW